MLNEGKSRRIDSVEVMDDKALYCTPAFAFVGK